jgi:hypothetical protein
MGFLGYGENQKMFIIVHHSTHTAAESHFPHILLLRGEGDLTRPFPSLPKFPPQIPPTFCDFPRMELGEWGWGEYFLHMGVEG